MGKIDGYKYPDISAQTAVEIADIIVNEFGGNPSSEEAFAQEVGHSSTKSGAYRSKIADARRWGVLPSRGIEATELAFRLANPQDEVAEEEAMHELYQNISLLKQLYDHLDGRKPPSEFWRVIAEVTDTNPKEAKDTAPDIRNLYNEMLKYELDETDEQQNSEEDDAEILDSDERIEVSQQTPSGGVFVKVGDDTLSLGEVSETNLELARFFLESKKREATITKPEQKADADADNKQVRFS